MVSRSWAARAALVVTGTLRRRETMCVFLGRVGYRRNAMWCQRARRGIGRNTGPIPNPVPGAAQDRERHLGRWRQPVGHAGGGVGVHETIATRVAIVFCLCGVTVAECAATLAGGPLAAQGSLTMVPCGGCGTLRASIPPSKCERQPDKPWVTACGLSLLWCQPPQRVFLAGAVLFQTDIISLKPCPTASAALCPSPAAAPRQPAARACPVRDGAGQRPAIGPWC